MNTSRKDLIWAGVFYIIATAAPILSALFLGFLGGGAGELIPDYLVQVSANEKQVVIGSLIELIWALSVVGIVVTLLPTLKKHREALAFGFSSLRFIEAISTVFHSILLLGLLTLSLEYAAAGTPEVSFFENAADFCLAAREWTYLIGSGLVWSLSALLLNYLLYLSKLIPRWLSVWGFAGAVLSFVAYLLQFFNINLSEFLYLPIGLQEMVFAVWLIAKGFNPSAISSESVEYETTGV